MTEPFTHLLTPQERVVLEHVESGGVRTNDPAVVALCARVPMVQRYLDTLAASVREDPSVYMTAVAKAAAWERLEWGAGVGGVKTRGIPPRRLGKRVRVSFSGAFLGARTLLRGVSFAAFLGVLVALIVRDHTLSQPSFTAARTYMIPEGRQAIVTLPNGSRALLGPATVLTVAKSTAGIGIDMTVRGQAYFSVTPRHQAPFTVRTRNSVTQVLGTTFLVRRYDADRATRVVVIDGRVSLRRMTHQTLAGANTVLAAGTLGIVDDSNNVNTMSSAAAEDYTAWTTGQLIFRKTAVRDIVVELQRVYGAEIRVADSTLAGATLTWTVPVTRLTLGDVLSILTEMLDAHTILSGQIITVVPGPAVVRKPVSSPSIHALEHQYGRE